MWGDFVESVWLAHSDRSFATTRTEQMKRKGCEKWELVLPRIGIEFRWFRSRVLDGNIAVWARLRDETADHLLDISLWTRSRGLISIWSSGNQADISCWPLALWFLGVKIHTYRNQFQVGKYSLPGWMMLLKVRLILWCPDIFVEGRNPAEKTWDASKSKLCFPSKRN